MSLPTHSPFLGAHTQRGPRWPPLASKSYKGLASILNTRAVERAAKTEGGEQQSCYLQTTAPRQSRRNASRQGEIGTQTKLPSRKKQVPNNGRWFQLENSGARKIELVTCPLVSKESARENTQKDWLGVREALTGDREMTGKEMAFPRKRKETESCHEVPQSSPLHRSLFPSHLQRQRRSLPPQV